MAEKKPKMTFEQSVGRLDEIVRLLEKGDQPLDGALSLYEEGARLVKACQRQLDAAEQKVVKLQKGPDGEPVELPFAEQEGQL